MYDLLWGQAWGPITSTVALSAETPPTELVERRGPVAQLARGAGAVAVGARDIGAGVARGVVGAAAGIVRGSRSAVRATARVVSSEGIKGLGRLPDALREDASADSSGQPADEDEEQAPLARFVGGDVRLEVSYEPLILPAKSAEDSSGSPDVVMEPDGTAEEALERLVVVQQQELADMQIRHNLLSSENARLRDQLDGYRRLPATAGANGAANGAASGVVNGANGAAHGPPAANGATADGARPSARERLRRLRLAAGAAVLARDQAERLPAEQKRALGGALERAESLIERAAEVMSLRADAIDNEAAAEADISEARDDEQPPADGGARAHPSSPRAR